MKKYMEVSNWISIPFYFMHRLFKDGFILRIIARYSVAVSKSRIHENNSLYQICLNAQNSEPYTPRVAFLLIRYNEGI